MIIVAHVTDAAAVVSPGRRRRWVHMHNRGNATVYVKYDGSDTELTALNGLPIYAKSERQLGNNGGDQDFWHDIEAICAAGGETDLVIHESE